MSSNKDSEFKKRLVTKSKKNRSVPIWVIAKTNRKVRTNKQRYFWRSANLGREIRYSIEGSRGER